MKKRLEKKIITIEISSIDDSNYADVLNLIMNQLKKGYTSGHDKNQNNEEYYYSLDTTVVL